MTYDPYAGVFGNDEFGGDPLFAVDVEDDIIITTDDGGDDGEERLPPVSIPSGDIPSGTVGSISYDRGDNEIVGRPTEVGGDDVVGAGRGPTKREREDARAGRERRAADTGNRNVGRAATDNPRSDSEGSGGGQGPVAGTIAASQDRFIRTVRSDGGSGGPTGDVGRVTGRVEPQPIEETEEALAEYLRQAALNKQPRVTTSTVRLGTGPTIREEGLGVEAIEFDSEIYGVKMNQAGDWLVTLKVPFIYRDSVTQLSTVTGMNMKTRMETNGLAV